MTRAAIVVVFAVAGLFVPALLGGAPLVYDTAVVVAILGVMAYGLDIVLSDLGEISLAHNAFFAGGAYAAALLSVDLGLNAWITLAGAIAVGLLMALVLGVITLRTREFAFSLVTYAASVVCYSVVSNWDVLGGSDGVVGIPTLDLSIGPLALTATNNRALWPYAYVLLLVTLWFVHRFRRSRLGQAALMVHMNPRLAAMSGLDGPRVRLAVFVVSAPVSAVAGWLYAYQRGLCRAGSVRHLFPRADADGGDPGGAPGVDRAGARHRHPAGAEEFPVLGGVWRQAGAGRRADRRALPVSPRPRQHPPAGRPAGGGCEIA